VITRKRAWWKAAVGQARLGGRMGGLRARSLRVTDCRAGTLTRRRSAASRCPRLVQAAAAAAPDLPLLDRATAHHRRPPGTGSCCKPTSPSQQMTFVETHNHKIRIFHRCIVPHIPVVWKTRLSNMTNYSLSVYTVLSNKNYRKTFQWKRKWIRFERNRSTVLLKNHTH